MLVSQLFQLFPASGSCRSTRPGRRRQHRRRQTGHSSLNSADLPLEQRLLLSAVTMTDREQMLLELVNRARLDPNAEAARYGISLNQGLTAGTISSAPKQPLAPHQILVNIAGDHSQDMLDRNYFSHTTLGTSNGPTQRANAAGYSGSVGENIAWGGSTGSINHNQQVFDRHRALFLSPGHRQNMLNPGYIEAGMGIRYGVFTDSGTNYNAAMVTENFSAPGVSPYLTGVVYNDLDGDGFYSIGEAIRSGTVTAVNTSTGTAYSATIGNSGGYAFNVPAGTYYVSAAFRVQNIDHAAVSSVTVASQNVKVDFQSQNAVAVNWSLSPATAAINESGSGSSVLLTLTRTGNTTGPLPVSLTSSDSTEISIPSSVTIPHGAASVQFMVTAVDDGIIDGDQISTISAAATGYPTRTATITTVDRSVPVLPASLISITPRPVISWQGVANAAHYEIWIANDSTGQGRLINHDGVTTTSYTPDADLPIGRYRVWVRGITAGSLAGRWSTAQVMQVVTRPVIAGAGSVHMTSEFNLQWSSVPGAVSYDVWVNHLTTSTSQYYRNLHVFATSLQLSDFQLGRHAIWVRARNAQGEFSHWSQQAVMTVSTRPVELSVSAADLGSPPLLSWAALPGASTYELWINNVTTGSSFHHGQQGIAGTQYQLPSTPPAGTYRAWVRARDMQGANHTWSTPFNFQVNRPAQVQSPLGQSPSATPAFQWTPVSGAVRYELWVAALSPAVVRVIHEQQLNEAGYQRATPLQSGTYRTWIRAFDATGAATSWSVGFDFTVADIQLQHLPGQLILTAFSGEADASADSVFMNQELLHRLLLSAEDMIDDTGNDSSDVQTVESSGGALSIQPFQRLSDASDKANQL